MTTVSTTGLDMAWSRSDFRAPEVPSVPLGNSSELLLRLAILRFFLPI